MEKYMSILVMVGICLLVLLIGVMKKQAKMLFGLIFRLVLGAGGILLANYFFEMQHIPLCVGINPLTLLAVGILGVCGFVLLYGILALQLL
ncbi:MAG: pro-sigmaK processing inhibitor BofA family protein [Lachnospiraceae bacterium]|nr:pro-sigmaK processing inhibitor BofA family protein [Lachnospiraceae bacterium]